MTAGKIEKLVRMANQIGDFYAAMPEKEAAQGVASHLRLHWTPKMIGEIIAAAETGRAGLNPTAAHAVDALACRASLKRERTDVCGARPTRCGSSSASTSSTA